MRQWCSTHKPAVYNKDGKEVSPEVRCRFQDMELKSATVLKVPSITAFVCPNCGVPRWLPGNSLKPFVDGLNA